MTTFDAWHFRVADRPDSWPLRFVIETFPSVWDPTHPNHDGTLGDWINYSPGYRRIAMTTDGGPDAKRDAMLMAAAPMLLEACHAALAARIGDDGPRTDDALANQLRAAIFQAEWFGMSPQPTMDERVVAVVKKHRNKVVMDSLIVDENGDLQLPEFARDIVARMDALIAETQSRIDMQRSVEKAEGGAA